LRKKDTDAFLGRIYNAVKEAMIKIDISLNPNEYITN
jgi:hypothetical protein